MHVISDLGRRHAAAVLVVGVLLTGLLTPSFAQTRGERVRFSMVALDLEGGGAVPLRVAIDRWTTDAENDRLLQILMTQGAKAFGQALRDVRPTGYVRTLDSLGWDLRYARETRGKDGGRHIMIITDRPIGFAESWYAGRSLEYEFTVIELQVNDEGRGDGHMSIATKLIPDKVNKLLIIENFDTQRIRLNQVRVE